MQKIIEFFKQNKLTILLTSAGLVVVIFFISSLVFYTQRSQQNSKQDITDTNVEIQEESIEIDNNLLDTNITSYLDDLEYVDAEEGVDLAIYNISGSELVLQEKTSLQNFVNEANNFSEHNFLWDYYYHIFGEIDVIEYIDRLVINTDGIEGSLASMYLNDDNIWGLYIDPADALKKGKFVDLPDFTYTLVHEFGHLLTLNASQVNHNVYDENRCTTRFISEGCLYTEAYAFAYFNEFWDNSLYEDWDYYVGYEGYEEDISYFYEENPGVFITEYAATDPDEDMAESFAHFVLTDKPNGKNVAEQKILFFYQYQELVEMREIIRNNILKLDADFFKKPLITK